MNSVAFNRLCYGFKFYPIKVRNTIKHLSDSWAQPTTKRADLPSHPGPQTPLSAPSYTTPAARVKHPPSGCTSPGPGWQTAASTLCLSTTGTPQPARTCTHLHCSDRVQGAAPARPQRGHHHREQWLQTAGLKCYKLHYRIITGPIQWTCTCQKDLSFPPQVFTFCCPLSFPSIVFVFTVTGLAVYIAGLTCWEKLLLSRHGCLLQL